MNYQKVYDNLIQHRKDNPLPKDTYGELHHIIPKSEGGTNDRSNLIHLSAREHYIAHLLLSKIYNDYAMMCALNMMRYSKNKNTKRIFKINSRLFEKMKVKHSQMMSSRMIGHQVSERTRILASRTGRNNKGRAPWNKGTHLTDEQKEYLRQLNIGKRWWNNGIEERLCMECPSGWVPGRMRKKKTER